MADSNTKTPAASAQPQITRNDVKQAASEAVGEAVSGLKKHYDGRLDQLSQMITYR